MSAAASPAMLRTLSRSAAAVPAVTVRNLHRLSPAVAEKANTKPTSKEVQDALAAHRRAVSGARKAYLADTRTAQQLAKEEELAHAKEKLAETKTLLSDPLLVGTFKPRRELKRDRQRNFGKFEPVPVDLTQPLPPPNAPPANVPEKRFNNGRQLRRIFARDLTPENPRLSHLLHLWHSSESFVTPRNIDQKLDEFFKQKPEVNEHAASTPVTQSLYNAGVAGSAQDTNLPLTTRLHRIIEHGVTDSVPSLSDFNPREFADTDKQFVPAEDTPYLAGGSLLEHGNLREIAVRDKLNDTLLGRPNVAKVLEWGKVVNKPSEYGWTLPKKGKKEGAAAVPAQSSAPVEEPAVL
ncbi:hypothetical protein BCR44DRAFT_36507 [Catenaria anguillulae PL171]|uniref:Uncharacterized protein n=1 Tax=Catenaria anguillulae PL171 TaxID=765915 RepID=A0A1Y2I1C4_9FUNG|nr:hypothetical protein BCR44DRAFT_36507 [Catenaria anguillulae PL171]